jgi:hypothetical protein
VSPSRCNRLEALAPSVLDAIRNEETWNHQIRLKNSRKITLRRRRRANLCDSPATYQNISAESGIQPRADDLESSSQRPGVPRLQQRICTVESKLPLMRLEIPLSRS